MPVSDEVGDLRTPQEAAAALQIDDLIWQGSGQTPAWAVPLLDAQGRFIGGALRAGTPTELLSPVDFEIDAAASAEEDAARAGTLQQQLRRFGNAALIPLLLADGRVAGLAKAPLYVGGERATDETTFVLFDAPVSQLDGPTEAARRAPDVASPDTVVAIALGDSARSYDPFNFHWLAVPDDVNDVAYIVPAGLPTLITQTGTRVQPDVGSAVRLDQDPGLISPAQAQQAQSVYDSRPVFTWQPIPLPPRVPFPPFDPSPPRPFQGSK